jgi:hypothetical protein
MAHVFASTDQGKTWEKRGGVLFPRFDFDEHMIVELRDGRLWMLARTLDGIAETYSSDQGRTWTPPKVRFPNINARFFIRRLAPRQGPARSESRPSGQSGPGDANPLTPEGVDSKLLLIKHGRIDERTPHRSHLTAFLSEDDGQTWRGGLVLDDRTGISYPDGFQAPNGTIYIIYDHNRYTDAEILLARFREEDVFAGRWSSPGARQRVLVNRATGKRRE